MGETATCWALQRSRSGSFTSELVKLQPSPRLRHPAVPVPLTGLPLHLGGPLEGPGVLERAVGPLSGDVLAGRVAGRGGVLGEVAASRRAGRPRRPRARSVSRSRPPARNPWRRGRRCRRCRTCRARRSASRTPFVLRGKVISVAFLAQADDVAAEPVGAGVGLVEGRSEPDGLEPAQPLGGLVAADPARQRRQGRPRRAGNVRRASRPRAGGRRRDRRACRP